VTFSSGDAAALVWETWLESMCEDDDPHLRAVISPPRGTAPAPLLWQVLGEVASILAACAPLRAAAFRAAGNTPGALQALLGAPLAAPPLGGVRFHHAAMAGARVAALVANPGPAFPHIHALPTGAYICTIQSAWVGTLQDTHVFRG